MIVLDTSALIWWVSSPEKLSKNAQRIIEEEAKKEEVLVSSISIWEVYLLVKKGRIVFSIDVDIWLERLEDLSSIQFVPVDNKVASLSVKLDDFENPDPADRMIVATAQLLGSRLITSDEKIINYKKVQTVW